MSHWTREYFERGYAQRWGLPGVSDDVRRQVGGLWTLLQLSPASCAVDIGCGHGRHAVALAERGPRVIGIDSSAALLDHGRLLAAKNSSSVRYIRADMRRLPLLCDCVDAALIMDAFGFFDTEEEHEAVAQEASRVLRTDGRLVLKVVNARHVLDDFHETEQEERDGVTVSVSNTLTGDPPRLMQRISVSGARGNGLYQRHQRLYQVEELSAALENAGFEIVDVVAAPDGARFDPARSPTMWLVASRGRAHG
jgi:ubiquinone/menaquinone biosynthesis C-methylase UbiE